MLTKDLLAVVVATEAAVAAGEGFTKVVVEIRNQNYEKWVSFFFGMNL